jgi:hypothetical protein
MRGLWFYLVRSGLLLNRRRMGHVPAEFMPERLCVVRINLGVIASTRDRNVCHAAIEQILSAQVGEKAPLSAGQIEVVRLSERAHLAVER